MVLSRGDGNDEEEVGGERRGGGRGRGKYEITVAAKYMPGDYHVEYASPWAGANYLPLVILILICFCPFFFLFLRIKGIAEIDFDFQI